MKPLFPFVPIILAITALNSTGASAGNARIRALSANAASFCQTALPVFDGNVRKRPLAVQNEGTGNAFVTCSFTAQGTELSLALVTLYSAGVAAQVSCTGVTGAPTSANEYVTQTVAVPASGTNVVTWTGSQFAGQPALIPGFGLFNVSCNLPSGVGITESLVEFVEPIGA